MNPTKHLATIFQYIEKITDYFIILRAIKSPSNKIRDFIVEYLNEAAMLRLGANEKQIIGKKFSRILLSDVFIQFPEIFDDLLHIMKTGKTLDKEYISYHDAFLKDSVQNALEIKAFPVVDSLALTCKDITSLKKNEEELKSLTLMDDLTGLYNRRGFMTLAQQQLKITNRMKREMLLLFADVDNLKLINDTHGHHIGDQALISAAQIFKATFREPDILARIGGDEFSVLIIEATLHDLEPMVRRFRKNLVSFNQKEKLPFPLSISIGITHYHPQEPCFLNELLEKADKLMYEEKYQKSCSNKLSLKIIH